MLETVVRLTDDGFFEFYLDGDMVYDFQPRDAAYALRWLEYMASKTWLTKEHVCQYANLAATHFGAGHV